MGDEGNDGVDAPKPIDETLHEKADRLAIEYPRAAVYLKAKGYTYASNYHKTGAGREAMEIIATGGSIEDANKALENWLPEESMWD